MTEYRGKITPKQQETMDKLNAQKVLGWGPAWIGVEDGIGLQFVIYTDGVMTGAGPDQLDENYGAGFEVAR